MICVVCLLAGVKPNKAVLVVNGYSVCYSSDEERHYYVAANALSYHELVMESRALIP